MPEWDVGLIAVGESGRRPREPSASGEVTGSTRDDLRHRSISPFGSTDYRGCKHDAREEESGASTALARRGQGPSKQETRPYLVPRH
jgi:hypothetical protein